MGLCGKKTNRLTKGQGSSMSRNAREKKNSIISFYFLDSFQKRKFIERVKAENLILPVPKGWPPERLTAFFLFILISCIRNYRYLKTNCCDHIDVSQSCGKQGANQI